MTPSEAVQAAIDNHKFRYFQPALINSANLVEAVAAVCWCNAITPPFLSEKSAREAHGRHRDRAASMRSFGQWDT